MGFFEKLRKQEGGYLFLSHSHNDIEKVRVIRNGLEQEGFEPLCFFLKCLNDDAEIFQLIKREIDAREWFVYLDSDNAKQSYWVNKEREYIGSADRKKIINVKLDDPEATSRVIRKILHNLRIYVTYAHRDRALGNRLVSKLKEKDYLVFSEQDIICGDNWASTIANAIVEAAKEGCVVALLTREALNSVDIRRELVFALESGGNVLPIFVGDAKPESALKFLLSDHQCFRLEMNPGDENLDKLIDKIGFYLLTRMK
jgi:hypothetical protein